MRSESSRVVGRGVGDVAAILIVLLLLPILVPLIAGLALYRWVKGLWLKWSFRRRWVPDGRIGVFVYSDSPNWKEYVEAHILPQIRDRVVTLNWSERSQWHPPKPVEVRVFEHWMGGSAYNPMAIILGERGSVQTLRFWHAFREFNGKTSQLLALQERLFKSVGAA